MRWNIEITVNFEHAPYISVHAQNNICIAKTISFSLQVTECACSNYFLATTSGSQEFLLPG